MNTSARMLRLLSLLQTHRYWPGSELSTRLEVSPRTLRRDIDRLREAGYAVDEVLGVAGGYQLRAGGSLPPLLLEDEEAVAIAVSLESAAPGWIAGLEDSFNSFLHPMRVRELTPGDVTGILRQGGTILGTTNRGNPFRFPTPEGERDVSGQVVAACRELGLDAEALRPFGP